MYKPGKETRGMIFDLDGTLADTMPLHFKAWQTTCRSFGMEMSREFLQSHMGRPGWEISKDIISLHGLNDKINDRDLVKAKVECYMAMENEVKEIRVIGDIVRKYHGIIPMAIGTGGFYEAARKTLSRIGMSEYFDVMVTADDVSKHKPHPETFLKAAELLDIEPAAIDVFEDGELGLEAARRAGMNPIDIRPWIKAW
jgi:beta-phosphoglucomutase-like phosphatase (HAD superfamily)